MKNKFKYKFRHIGRTFFSFAVALAFFLFISRSQVAIDYMKKGLELCARTVIPSLFPLMAVSNLAVRCGSGRLLGKIFSKPARWLLGVGEDSACAFVFGAVCGFPIAATVLCDAYDSGRISRRELERSMTFCNNPGAAFVISAVGVSLFGSLWLGVAIYVCVLLSALTVGIAQRIIFGGVAEDNGQTRATAKFTAKGGIISAFTSAMQGSALSMLTVCAYVAFFSSLVGCIGSILAEIGVNSNVSAAIFGFFELSSGVGAASEISGYSAILLSSATLGWSGMSVHFQIMTVSSGRGISFKPYFLSKMAQSIICASLVFVTTKLFPFSKDVFLDVKKSFPSAAFTNGALACIIFFAAVIIPFTVSFIRKHLIQKNEGRT